MERFGSLKPAFTPGSSTSAVSGHLPGASAFRFPFSWILDQFWEKTGGKDLGLFKVIWFLFVLDKPSWFLGWFGLLSPGVFFFWTSKIRPPDFHRQIHGFVGFLSEEIIPSTSQPAQQSGRNALMTCLARAARAWPQPYEASRFFRGIMFEES